MDNGGCLMDTDKFFTSKATTLEVHHRTYDPSSASSRHVFLFHALHEHCNKFSYQVLADQLGKGGATVHGLDMQAHGHSDEVRYCFRSNSTRGSDNSRESRPFIPPAFLQKKEEN